MNNDNPFGQPEQPNQAPNQFPQPSQTPLQPPPQTQPAPIQSTDLNQANISSYDYLDVISKDNRQNVGFSRKQIFLIGGALLFIITFMIIAITVGGSSKSGAPSTLSYTAFVQSSSLTTVTKESQKNIKNHNLANINSSLSTQLTTTNADLTRLLEKLGLDTKKIPKDITETNNSSEVLEKLNDARLEGRFDRAYQSEVFYNLQTLLLTVDSLAGKTKDDEIKSELENLSKNLRSLQEQIANIATD